MTSSVVPIAGAAPAWYADPWQQAPLRWWDGAAWSGHTAGAAGPGAPTGNEGLEFLLPVNTDGFAIASGYLGLFSLIPNPFTSIAAIALGIAALQRIKRTGKHGKGRAVVGLAIGGLSLGLFMLIVLTANLSPHA